MIKIIIIIIIIGFIFLLLKKINNNKINKDIIKKRDINCRLPTMNNPYANNLIGLNDNLEPCDEDIEDIENIENIENLKKEFNDYNIYINSRDVNFGYKNKINRDFYTKPKNDIKKFINELYSNKEPTCKIDNNCYLYNDLRYAR